MLGVIVQTRMNRLLFILVFLSARLLGQINNFDLPNNFRLLVIKETSQRELIKTFGKPSKKSSCKVCGCLRYPYKTKRFVYDNHGMTIFLERTKDDKTYRVSEIYFSQKSEIVFGKSIKIGISTPEEVFNDLGEPTSKFDNPVSGMRAEYLVKSKNLVFVFQFDLKSRKLTDVSVLRPRSI